MSIQAREGHSFRFWDNADKDINLSNKAMKVLNETNLQDKANVLADNLAHGEQRQLEVAMALATSPKMLLLDEPMAGMGPEESSMVTKFLNSMKTKYTMLLIEHDMGVVMDISDRVVVLDYGKVIGDGTPDEIMANQKVIDAYLGVEH